MQPQVTRASWVMVAALGLIWGATFMVTELALEGITPFWLAAGRIGVAATLMIFVWGLRGWALFEPDPSSSPANARPWFTLGLAGALSLAVPFMLLSWGQQYVTSGFAGVSMAVVALIVLPLAHFLVPGEALNLRKTAGFVVGFAGVLVLIGGKAFDSTGSGLESAGRLASLAAAACYAVGSILVRRLPPIDPIGLATVLMMAGAAIAIPTAWVFEGPPPRPPPTCHAARQIAPHTSPVSGLK
ncbi:MAG: DMT family transporter [Hyphomicrobiales bacterium]